MELTDFSLLALAHKLDAKEASSVEAVQACLRRIEQVDGQVHAFLRVDAEGALDAFYFGRNEPALQHFHKTIETEFAAAGH